MNVRWVYEGITLIVGMSMVFGGLRPGRNIVVAQRTFFITCGFGVLCALALPLVDARLFGDILDFGVIVCGEIAFLSVLIWRFPRIIKVFVDADDWHTPTT